MNKNDYIQEISNANNHYGDKLIELMEIHGAFNLQDITEEQAREFYCKMIQEVHNGENI